MMERCLARDALAQQCAIYGPHEEVINSAGQRAIVHHTPQSMWSTALHDLQVASAFTADPQMLGKMLDRARTPVAGVPETGTNSEEEMLTALRLGYERGVLGKGPGENTLPFTLWPNGVRAFQTGYEHAQQETAHSIIQEARS